MKNLNMSGKDIAFQLIVWFIMDCFMATMIDNHDFVITYCAISFGIIWILQNTVNLYRK